jgi:hypothetical protein
MTTSEDLLAIITNLESDRIERSSASTRTFDAQPGPLEQRRLAENGNPPAEFHLESHFVTVDVRYS